MEKSLNSSRNFKLPPIQGAVPAATILRQPTTRNEQTWPRDYGRSSVAMPNHQSTKPRPVIHVPKDPFPGRYRSPSVGNNLSNVRGQQRAFNARTIENEKSKESLTLEFAPRVHQFPQSYTVLPPIQKIQKPPATQTEVAAQIKHKQGETKLTADLKSTDDVGKSSDKQKFNDARKLEDKSENSNTDHNNVKSDSGTAKNVSKKKQRLDPVAENKETGERKPSATTVLFLKGKRLGRRVGVCLENEPALINVTEQLKEIFLRRNMEEMYLI